MDLNMIELSKKLSSHFNELKLCGGGACEYRVS